MNTMLMES